MKKKSRLRKITIIATLLVMSLFPMLSGCKVFDTLSNIGQLSTPEITINDTNRIISWKGVGKASGYKVYCNDKELCVIDASASNSTYVYDFSSALIDSGDYTFKVVAVSSIPKLMSDSDSSNAVSMKFNGQIIPTNTSVTYSNNYHINFEIKDYTKVKFTPLSDGSIDGYELYLYSNTSGLNVYPVTTTEVQLQDTTYRLNDEIYAVRLGVVADGNHYVCSDIKYVNMDNYLPFTGNIYTFDGYLNDYYIETLPELKNIVYYGFISRISELKIRLSNNFATNVLSLYAGENKVQRLCTAVSDIFSNYIMETRQAYKVACNPINLIDNTYSIQVNYDDFLNSKSKPECDLHYTPENTGSSYLPNNNWEPFYETTCHIMRSEDEKYSSTAYDDFVSDRQFVSTTVTTSEELYWAVENKVTPIVTSGSRAEQIYNIAKSTLNSIVSDDMTDYEKVLSIFDWICCNTIYDNLSTTHNAYKVFDFGTITTSDDQEGITVIPVYYLEGVFLTGFAVCDGLSKAFSLMCNMEGIDAIRIVGTARAGNTVGGHAWNKVLLDKNPEDNIPAEYYTVDITWTTTYDLDLEEEVTLHTYFLLSDAEIAETHFYYSNRNKFGYYTSSDIYGYHNNTIFQHNDNNYDLVITSDEELDILLDYILLNNKKYMEIVFDYDYMCSNYLEKTESTKLGSYDEICTIMQETIRDLKFAEQYLELISNQWELRAYANGKKGVVVVIDQSFLIDSSGEIGQLIRVFNDNKIYGTMDVYISEAILESVELSLLDIFPYTAIEQMPEEDLYVLLFRKLFSGPKETYGKDITIEFSFVQGISVDNNNAKYVIVVS